MEVRFGFLRVQNIRNKYYKNNQENMVFKIMHLIHTQ